MRLGVHSLLSPPSSPAVRPPHLRSLFRPDALRLTALAVALGSLAACDSFGDPERFYNDDARPPVVGSLDLSALRPGQHVAGVLRVTLDLDSLAGRVERVEIAVDDGGFGPAEGLPRRFFVQTDAYPDGEHTISVAIYLRDARTGLLGVVGAPSMVLSVPLVFDQRPPTPIASVSATIDADRRPRITWEPNTDANFYAYVVSRYPAYEQGRTLGDAVVDTVYDQGTTVLVGAPLPDVLGARIAALVEVTNRREFSQLSDPAYATYGLQSIPTDVFSGDIPSSNIARSGDGSEFYFVSGSRLIALSSSTYEETRSTALTGLTGISRSTAHIEADPASGRLYVAAESGSQANVYVIDPSSFTVSQTYQLPTSTTSFVVSGDRLYTVTRALYVIDAATGDIVAQTEEVFPSIYSEIAAVSRDGRSVYVMDVDFDKPSGLVRVDVSGETPRLSERHATATTIGWSAAVGTDGRIFLSTDGLLEALDSVTLDPLSRYTAGAAFEGIHAAGGRLFGSTIGDVPLFPSGGRVTELDLETLRPMGSQALSMSARQLVLGADGRLLAFVPGRAWVLDL